MFNQLDHWIIDSPLNDPESTQSQVLGYIDYVFTFLFFFEACIKIIALGFFWSSVEANCYISNGWYILDFIVVSASLVDFFMSIQNSNNVDTGQLKSLKALRALRALRPLRMISRNEGMKLVITALFSSIPSMTNVLIVCLLFISIFASTGISFFAGKFYH
jgi:voltage-dependent calcium channel L type alpha-1D